LSTLSRSRRKDSLQLPTFSDYFQDLNFAFPAHLPLLPWVTCRSLGSRMPQGYRTTPAPATSIPPLAWNAIPRPPGCTGSCASVTYLASWTFDHPGGKPRPRGRGQAFKFHGTRGGVQSPIRRRSLSPPALPHCRPPTGAPTGFPHGPPFVLRTTVRRAREPPR
jgi:hypothetical protein